MGKQLAQAKEVEESLLDGISLSGFRHQIDVFLLKVYFWISSSMFNNLKKTVRFGLQICKSSTNPFKFILSLSGDLFR